MAWTAPMTFVAGTVLTAAQLNQQLRDNLLETVPAKATAGSQIFVSTGANAIAARTPTANLVGTSETTASTSYVDLATPGPAVTVTTGGVAIIIITALERNSTAGSAAKMSFAISGATTLAANDAHCLLHISATINAALTASAVILQSGLTAGANTFTAKYCVDSGTGNFINRRIAVIPL